MSSPGRRISSLTPALTPAFEFGTLCGGTYVVEYSADLKTWKTSPQTASGNGLTVAWRDAGQPATDSMPNTLTARFYRVRSAF